MIESQILNTYKRDNKFELKLIAVEENSGSINVLKTFTWGKTISIEYDQNQQLHTRLKLNHLNTFCKLKHSEFVIVISILLKLFQIEIVKFRN